MEKVILKDEVGKGKQVYFSYFRDGEFWYKTDSGFIFPISLKDINEQKLTLLATDKAIYFMRWIRKYIEEVSS